jgi:hypothetical protein
MAYQQVLLQGDGWRRHLLIWALLIVIALAVLHLWRPGLINSIVLGIYDAFVSMFDYLGSFFNNLREIIHRITGW